MGRSSKKAKSALSAAKQLEFHPVLVAARRAKLSPAVSEAAAGCDQGKLRGEITRFGDRRVLKLAAAAGIRDEHVVATPTLLRQKPSAIAFYRLLAGISKKQFYHRAVGLGALEAMEEGGALTQRHEALLDRACTQLNELISELVLTLESDFTSEDVKELPLLQLGAQLDGAHRVKIGEAAAQEVFALIGELLRKHVTSASGNRLEVVDATGTRVVIRRSGDPDILITRDDGSARPRKIAIEIKGGKDLSNAHNRAGEAEKSHVNARIGHATDFWTIASLPKVRLEEFKAQSPTTTVWFDLSEVLGRNGPAWEEFRRQIASAVGVRVT
jgi:hypothetical protein